MLYIKYVFMLLAAVMGVGGYFHVAGGQPNQYPMPASEAYKLLSNVTLRPSNDAPFGRLDTTVTGDGDRIVTWSGSGAHAQMQCDLVVSPLKAKLSRVDVLCDGASVAGAGHGMLMNMTRNAVIKVVDETLRDRP